MNKPKLNYEIEKNMPIPEYTQWGKNIHFLKKLEIGDSFVVEGNSRSSFLISARRMGIKAVSRSLGNGKARIWRVK